MIGVSADDWESHRDFAAKFGLPFTLLIDAGGALRQRFGNPDGSEALISRITYIVDAEGAIRAVGGGEGFTVDDHLALVAEWAAKFKAARAASL